MTFLQSGALTDVRRLARRATAIVAACLASLALASACAAQPSASAGEAIYRKGLLMSGASLEGLRADDAPRMTGGDAACVNCHQRSGLGATEGLTRIPPVAGLYLFHPIDKRTGEYSLPYVEGIRRNRQPYTDASLARAIREGVDADGKPLGYLMPRFAIPDDDMAALIQYLRGLDSRHTSGVTDAVLHFATVFTPDVAPARRQAVLDVIEAYFVDKNRFRYAPDARLQGSVNTMYANSMYRASRRWELHVWDLQGPEGTWRAQLERHLADEPVFAIVSGLAGAHWAPVHDFCEREALPCLFPNVDAPIDAPDDFYTVYLSKGVRLEAELVASTLAGGVGIPPVVHQVYRAGDVGEPAARALSDALARQGVVVRNHLIAAGAPPSEAARRVGNAAGAGVLVLWLRPADLAALGDAPARGPQVYLSGLMAGLEGAPLPNSWRPLVHMTYPFELPDKRAVRIDFARGWFNIRHIPVVDERLQVDTYLACGLLAETVGNLAGTFVRPYLIEQLQARIGHRIITGYYPHLTLASSQHFASKGAYLVRFQASGHKVAAESDWIVP